MRTLRRIFGQITIKAFFSCVGIRGAQAGSAIHFKTKGGRKVIDDRTRSFLDAHLLLDIVGATKKGFTF